MTTTIWDKAYIQRFWSKVDSSGGSDACWPWTGRLNDLGYGQYWCKTMCYGAHRLAKAIADNIPIPARSIHAAHDCPGGDNPQCCNPKHLKWMTTKEHGADKVLKGQMRCGDLHPRRQHPEKFSSSGNFLSKRGELNSNAKLTTTDVRKIKQLLLKGTKRPDVFRKFSKKVTRGVIRNIALGKSWTHVQP